MKSYEDLEIYQVSFSLAMEVHFSTMNLPKHEMYELGSQTRRSSQSISANIVEGYGRRRYKADFIKFLVYAQGSLLETVSHLEMLTKLYEMKEINALIIPYKKLGSQLNNFIQYVETHWQS
jgi:four helix bundle protein